MKPSEIIYCYEWNRTSVIRPPKSLPRRQAGDIRQRSWLFNPIIRLLGLGMIALALGGLTGPMIPRLRLETQHAFHSTQRAIVSTSLPTTSLQGESLQVQPADLEFSLIVPKIGINARVIPSVNPAKPGEYQKALEQGIAHSSLSYLPDQDGTVYLFSHSTNYDWFVKDLNAVFYLLKNLEKGDLVVVYYKNTPYTYKITGKQVVKPTAIEYLVPQSGAKRLILQTCWPPGSVAERLLIFADLVSDSGQSI